MLSASAGTCLPFKQGGDPSQPLPGKPPSPGRRMSTHGSLPHTASTETSTTLNAKLCANGSQRSERPSAGGAPPTLAGRVLAPPPPGTSVPSAHARQCPCYPGRQPSAEPYHSAAWPTPVLSAPAEPEPPACAPAPPCRAPPPQGVRDPKPHGSRGRTAGLRGCPCVSPGATVPPLKGKWASGRQLSCQTPSSLC